MPFGGQNRPVDDPARLKGSAADWRDQGQRDADRILYSSAYRRLTGVTQVISPQDDYVYHDRCMHSQKVAQVGHRITQALNRSYDERVWGTAPALPEVVYTAALAHDLGHPPFGHAAEMELQSVLGGKVNRAGRPENAPEILSDLFEGNAQTFRIVTRLAARKADERLVDGTKVGLNLQWVTYAAILKYPWLHGDHPITQPSLSNKWGSYDSEQEFLNQAKIVAQSRRSMKRRHWAVDAQRSLEAQLMDWADDVAYAVHDTEDFFRAKQIPLDLLNIDRKGASSTWQRLKREVMSDVEKSVIKAGSQFSDATFDSVTEDVRGSFPDRGYHGDTETRERLHRFASTNIEKLTANLKVRDGVLIVPVESIIRAEFLKKLTKRYVIDTADLRVSQTGQRGLVRRLYFDLFAMSKDAFGSSEDPSQVLPSRLFEYCDDALAYESMRVCGTDDAKLARAVVDFICSLTDRQAAILAQRLSGDAIVSSTSWVTV